MRDDADLLAAEVVELLQHVHHSVQVVCAEGAESLVDEDDVGGQPAFVERGEA